VCVTHLSSHVLYHILRKGHVISLHVSELQFNYDIRFHETGASFCWKKLHNLLMTNWFQIFVVARPRPTNKQLREHRTAARVVAYCS